MRSLARRKQDVWITKETRGTPHELPVGIVAEYSRYLISYDRGLELEEGDLLFVDITPDLTPNGALRVDINGTPYTSPDYVVSNIMDTAKGTIARYGIRKIA